MMRLLGGLLAAFAIGGCSPAPSESRPAPQETEPTPRSDDDVASGSSAPQQLVELPDVLLDGSRLGVIEQLGAGCRAERYVACRSFEQVIWSGVNSATARSDNCFYRTHDGGRSWATLACVDAERGEVLDWQIVDGSLWVLADQLARFDGAWRPIKLPAGAIVRDFAFASASIGFAVGESVRAATPRGVAFRTRNGGSTWEDVSPSEDARGWRLRGVAAPSARRVWMAGDISFGSEDAGGAWRPITGVPAVGSDWVRFADERFGWMGGSGTGSFFFTVDGGLDWSEAVAPVRIFEGQFVMNRGGGATIVAQVERLKGSDGQIRSQLVRSTQDLQKWAIVGSCAAVDILGFNFIGVQPVGARETIALGECGRVVMSR